VTQGKHTWSSRTGVNRKVRYRPSARLNGERDETTYLLWVLRETSGTHGYGVETRPVLTWWESKLDPVASRSDPTVARFSAQAERQGSPIPRCGHRTCVGTEEGALLADVWTIVLVVGQTQKHAVTLDPARARTVPLTVP